MKRIVEQSEKEALSALTSAKAQALLKYVLSPVEKTALRRSFRPFQFNLNGTKIYISGRSSRRPLFILKDKLDLLIFIATKERKSGDIPLYLREVFDDPAEILDLPAQTRNRLCAIECYTMYSVIQLGRSFFINWRGFGKKSLAELDALFAKHDSENLFK